MLTTGKKYATLEGGKGTRDGRATPEGHQLGLFDEYCESCYHILKEHNKQTAIVRGRMTQTMRRGNHICLTGAELSG